MTIFAHAFSLNKSNKIRTRKIAAEREKSGFNSLTGRTIVITITLSVNPSKWEPGTKSV